MVILCFEAFFVGTSVNFFHELCKTLGAWFSFPSMCSQVWPQRLCPTLTSSVRPLQEQTPTQPDWQQQLHLVCFEMDPEAIKILLKRFTNTPVNLFTTVIAYINTVVLSLLYYTYLFATRSGSDASSVLWCDSLGGLSCQPFPAAGCSSQQLGQSAGGKPEPAEPTAGQSAARQKTGMLIASGSRCICLLMCQMKCALSLTSARI